MDDQPGIAPVLNESFRLAGSEAELAALGADIAQASDGVARIIGVRLSNASGDDACSFFQGDRAIFDFEFEIATAENGRVFVASLAVRDEAQTVIYCRDALQRGMGIADPLKAGNRIRCRQEVALDLRPDKYFFTIGLYSVDSQIYATYQRREIPHLEFHPHVKVHVSAKVGMFSVDLDRHGQLRHYGIADLPAEMAVKVLAPRDRAPGFNGQRQLPPAADKTFPTVVHVTHWKAGSQWIRRILESLAPERVIEPRADNSQFLVRPLMPGGVYPTVYVSRNDYDKVSLSGDVRRIVVIRDLRDTLVSAYFSLRYSHEENRPEITRFRKMLLDRTAEEGMLLLMDEWLPPVARMQVSWIEAGEPVIRYRDLLERDEDILVPVLREHLGFDSPIARIKQAIQQTRFENMAGGRHRGEEDRSAHQRKGIAGDWKNHFSDRLKRAFKIRHGAILIEAGYERNLNW
jgi:lipopolysaccharide transport system ATP-binding protein